MRKTDWQQKLDAFIEARRYVAHKWGETDCVLFVADAVREMTGTDHAAKVRGKYDSQKQAYAILQELGGYDKVLTDAFGESRGPNNARKGDVVIYRPFKDDTRALGICLGTHFAAPGDNELLFFRMHRADRSWRVE